MRLIQLRAITKEQMEWLTKVAESVPLKHGLDLGFGCGFSAVAMARGGCSVTCVNNEPASAPRRIEAEQRYQKMCGQPPTIIEASTDSALPRLGIAHRGHPGPPKRFEVATENAGEFLLYPGQIEAAKHGFEIWKSNQESRRE
jgi:hypothetical protein